MIHFWRKCYWTICGNLGQKSKDEEVHKPSLTYQPFPSLFPWLPFLMILHQAESLQWEQDALLAGRATTVPNKFRSWSEKKKKNPKFCQSSTAFSFHLRSFLVDLSNCSNAHRLDVSTRMIQEWHKCGCVRMLPFCSRGRITFSSARQKGKHFASSNIKKTPKLGKLSCQTALGTQILPLCKYSWGRESRNMDEMEQALDVLSCCLVLKYSHSSRHTGTGLGWFQLAGPSQQNYQCQLELTAGNMWGGLNTVISPSPKLSSTCKVLCIHVSERKDADAVCAGAAMMPELENILCHMPSSLGLTEGFGASLLCPLTAPAARSSWQMMCWYSAACSAAQQGREALVLLLFVLQPFEIKYCLFFPSNPSPLWEPSVFHFPSKPQGAQRLMHKNWSRTHAVLT